jgi:hypothetical protein
MPFRPEDFSEPGSGNVDYRLNRDSSGPPNNWRRDTPPAGEDGSVPDRRLTVTGGSALSGGGVLPSLYPSTFDIPDSEMG